MTSMASHSKMQPILEEVRDRSTTVLNKKINSSVKKSHRALYQSFDASSPTAINELMTNADLTHVDSFGEGVLNLRTI